MYQWVDEAPSNIALIKYMGKKDNNLNLPDNSSLSYTLNHLISRVSIQLSKTNDDCWQPLQAEDMPTEINLSSNAQTRFLKHFKFLKKEFKIKQNFIIKSNNNFPASCGIASSASSFAALTKCAIKAFCYLNNQPSPSTNIQAGLSRIGSGSSCRSFFSPWALWENDEVKTIDFPQKQLHHQVIIIEKSPKQISSSNAHNLVNTSPNYRERTKRAQDNLIAITKALNTNNWHAAYKICWQEFQDMHGLFHTCSQPFSYINTDSEKILNNLQSLWQQNQDGPIITMDAGPNIHLLYRSDQLDMAKEFKQKHLIGYFDVI